MTPLAEVPRPSVANSPRDASPTLDRLPSLSRGQLRGLKFLSRARTGSRMTASTEDLFSDMRLADDVSSASTSPLVSDEDGDASNAKNTSTSPWYKSAIRRFSAHLDADMPKLTAAVRSKSSLGQRAYLSKYTPLPAIGSQLSAEDDRTMLSDECLEELAAEEHEQDLGNESNDDTEEDDDGQKNFDASNVQADEQRPPLIRSRTFTVLKERNHEKESSVDRSELRKGGIAFFIGDTHDDTVERHDDGGDVGDDLS